jgi:hypothetical protein
LRKSEEAARLAADLARVVAEKETLAARVEDLRRPWWKRWFGVK